MRETNKVAETERDECGITMVSETVRFDVAHHKQRTD